MAKDREDSLKHIVALAKRRGFVFAGSEIYGGLSNTFDYGPLGIEILQNLKKLWWEYFVHKRKDVVGLDSSILLNPTVWEASGHVSNFSDPLMDCKSCKTRIRVDHFLEEKKGEGFCSGKTLKELQNVILEEKFPCPNCGSVGTFTDPRSFNLMFKTSHGASEDNSTDIYLRPETAQGIFINFKNIYNSSRQKVPFGIAQIGKSFRNEIMARQFIFRTREFEQMEMEFFCEPGTQVEWFTTWVDYCMNWLTNVIGLKKENLRIREHEKEELSFYSDRTADIEYKFPFGWGELWGIASRTDYDLKQHEKFSGQDLKYHDQVQNKKYLPFVVEPALGLNRLFLAVMSDAYEEEKLEEDIRTVLHLNPKVSPFKLAIFPLMKKDGLDTKAKEIQEKLSKIWYVDYDDSAAIGKRYRRHDEIGTPFCVTVDYDSLKDNTVTIRERDNMKQDRISESEIMNYVLNKMN
jgi:glycyl-tRNA synthetase